MLSKIKNAGCKKLDTDRALGGFRSLLAWIRLVVGPQSWTPHSQPRQIVLNRGEAVGAPIFVQGRPLLMPSGALSE